MKNNATTGGYTIVEVIVAIAIVIGALVGFFIFAVASSEVGSITIARQEATAVAQEGIEVARLLRDEDWDTNIAPIPFNTARYPSISGGVWALSATDPGPVFGVYDRELRVFEVFRDASDDIAVAGTPDADTVLIRSTVSWTRKGQAKQLMLETYITNWRSFLP